MLLVIYNVLFGYIGFIIIAIHDFDLQFLKVLKRSIVKSSLFHVPTWIVYDDFNYRADV